MLSTLPPPHRPSDPEARFARTELFVHRLELLVQLVHPHDLDARRSHIEELSDTNRKLAPLRGSASPDQWLVERLQLSSFEHEVLWASVAPQLRPSLQRVLARAQDNHQCNYMTPALCLRLFALSSQAELASRRAVGPQGTLAQWGLVRHAERQTSRNNPMLQELVPAPHLVSWLEGERWLGDAAEYAAIIEPLKAGPLDETPPTKLRKLAVGFFQRGAPQEEGFGQRALAFNQGALCVVRGQQGSGRSYALKQVARHLQRRIVSLDGLRLTQAPSNQRAGLLQDLCRQAALYGELLLIRRAEAILAKGSALAGVLAAELRRFPTLCVAQVDAELDLDAPLAEVLLANLNHDSAHEKRRDSAAALWRAHVPPGCEPVDEKLIQVLCSRIQASPLQIRNAVHFAYLTGQSSAEGVQLDIDALEQAVRSQLTSTLGALAASGETTLSRKDLILPEETSDQIDEILSAARSRDMVLHQWGLARVFSRGTGLVCLFDGDPGTGKTLAAEVIAGELGLQLMQINVSAIVDKYIGETEKNLTRIFASARPDLHLLLFDEADSLFSKRTEVKRSTDRYSNMDVNVLLQLIEKFEGIAVLTTNLKRSIDPAFERRIAFKVSFPIPEESERELLWRALLPEDVPTSEPVEYDVLAEIELAGGGIKNAVMRAAYAAAREGCLMDMGHLYEAARREVASEGRLVRDEIY